MFRHSDGEYWFRSDSLTENRQIKDGDPGRRLADAQRGRSGKWALVSDTHLILLHLAATDDLFADAIDKWRGH